MGRVLVSPVAAFPGSVTLIEHPTLEMLADFTNAAVVGKEKVSRTDSCLARFNSVNAFVACWAITGQDEHPTLDTLNVIPKVPFRDLLEWLANEVDKWLDGVQEIPKDLEPVATPTPQPDDTSPAN